MSSSEPARLWAVVMAGGAGTRFWPSSRLRRPKQLLPLLEGRSPLVATVERLAPLIPPERTLVVVGAELAAATQAQLPDLPPDHLLVEPIGRDTAACVGLASWWLARRDSQAIAAVLPADHAIPDGAALRRALAAAAATAHARGGLVTLGIRPTRPETGFGYLELGEPAGEVAGQPVHPVMRFVEKPDRAAAEAMLAAGGYRWNSGMFVWSIPTICAAIRLHLPELAAGLDAIFAAPDVAAGLTLHYPGLPRVSVDYGVMERAAQVWAVPVEFAWSDLGSWSGLADLLAPGGGELRIGEVLTIDTERCVLVGDGPVVAAVGVEDLVVVATPDAVLIVPRDQTQRVKEIVERLRAAGRTDLL